MNVRLMKETRDLLPLFMGTLLLVMVPGLIWRGGAGGLACLVLAGGCVVMAGCSFGNELQQRTMSLLLSQPIARSVLWRDKMLVLGAGIGTVLVVAEVWVRLLGTGLDADVPLGLALSALCAFCGGAYWTLRLRHSINGIVCTAAAPLGLLAGYTLIMEWLQVNKELQNYGAIPLLVLYCAVVYWQGYALFKRLEDFEGSARELKLPAGLESVLARRTAGISGRFRGPFATLLKKELRLLQASYLLAGMFVLVAVVGFCLLLIRKALGAAILGGDMGVFLLVLPLITGAITVAEERGWQLAEWQLTLPPSALRQWSAKMLVTFATSLGLGLVLPAALFVAGAALRNPSWLWSSLPPASQVAAWVLGQMLLTSLVVYAASFSKNTNQALAATFGLVGICLTVFILTGRLVGDSVGHWGLRQLGFRLNLLLPVVLSGSFLLLCLTQWLAWSNFRHLGASARRLVPQWLLVFGAVAVFSLAILAAMVLAADAGRP
jgi:hypothetical protein